MSEILLIGEINFDIYIYYKNSYHTDKFITKPGGVPLNIAYSLKNLNTDSKIYSFIGSDSIGSVIKKEIQNDFDLDLINTEKYTNIIVYLISDNDVKIFGLKKENPVFLLSPKIKKIVEKIKIIHFSPYIFLNEKNFEFFNKITNYNKIFSINLSISLLKNKKFIEILKKFDLIFMNIEEAQFLIQNHDIDEIISFLKQNYKSTILTTNDFVFYISKEKEFKFKYEVVKSKINIGAGDCFIGGFIFGLINNLSVEDSLQYGIDVSKKYIINLNLSLKSSNKHNKI